MRPYVYSAAALAAVALAAGGIVAGLRVDQCQIAFLLVSAPEQHYAAVRVCGDTPLPAYEPADATVQEMTDPFPRPDGSGDLTLWNQWPFPAEVVEHMGCACRPKTDLAGDCKRADGRPALLVTTMSPGSWLGACARKLCSEPAGFGEPDWSMPPECRP